MSIDPVPPLTVITKEVLAVLMLPTEAASLLFVDWEIVKPGRVSEIDPKLLDALSDTAAFPAIFRSMLMLPVSAETETGTLGPLGAR